VAFAMRVLGIGDKGDVSASGVPRYRDTFDDGFSEQGLASTRAESFGELLCVSV